MGKNVVEGIREELGRQKENSRTAVSITASPQVLSLLRIN